MHIWLEAKNYGCKITHWWGMLGGEMIGKTVYCRLFESTYRLFNN